MEQAAFLGGAMTLFSLLTVAVVVSDLCRRAGFPFAVGLLAAGGLLGGGLQFLGAIDQLQFVFSPELVFYVFLPTIIFESAYQLDFRQFRRVLPEVSLLATLGLGLSALVIALGLSTLLQLDWGAALIFGVLISATDPVSVLAIFKELRVPKRLSTIVEGESLINDATALVIFGVLISLYVDSTLTITPQTALGQAGALIAVIVLSLSVGAILGWLFSAAISRTGQRGVQLTLSLILAHLTFILAEGFLHMSGILATMAAGIIVGNVGVRRLHEQERQQFDGIWDFMGFVSNSLVFLLLGVRLAQIDLFGNWPILLVSIVITLFVARPISVLSVFGVSNRLRRPHHRTPLATQSIIIWGGLRGTLSAAAVLLIPDTYPFAEPLQIMTTGVIGASFFLNATTMKWLLKRLHITDFTLSERIQQLEAEILIDEAVVRQLDRMHQRKFIPTPVHQKLKVAYEQKEVDAVLRLSEIQEKLSRRGTREIEKILSYHALGIEGQTYRQLFDRYEISEQRYLVLVESILRQRERLERDELPQERQSKAKFAPVIPQSCQWAPTTLWGIPHRWWVARRDRLIRERLQHYRARKIASNDVIEEFSELLANQNFHIEAKIIQKIINRYRKWNRNAERKLQGIRGAFADVAHQAEIQMAEHSCLQKEIRIEEDFYRKGLISARVHRDRQTDIAQRVRRNLRR